MRVIICTSLLDLAPDLFRGLFFCLASVEANPVYRHIRFEIRTISHDGKAAYVFDREALRHGIV